jgi:DNA-binding PucR family transcriptional regulator
MTPACLITRRGPLTAAVLPDPAAPGARQRLLRALRGTTAVIGPTVPLARLPESAQVAEAAAQTLERPAAAAGPLVAVEHLDAIIVHRDRRLLEVLRAEQLRPLEQAPPGSRAALRDTLRAWLVHMGSVRAVSEELGVHPQTVRYRLGRLQELFGPALEDPAARLRLLLAVGWEPAGPAAPAVPEPAPAEARRARRTG